MSAGKVILGIGIGVVLVPILVVGGCTVILGLVAHEASEDVAEASIADKVHEIQVEASDLYAAYDENEIAADAQFKGKVLLISGTVRNLGKDITDTMYVSLRGGDIIFGAQCFFTDRHAQELAQLKEGDRIRVKGRCDGKFGNVLVRGCTLED